MWINVETTRLDQIVTELAISQIERSPAIMGDQDNMATLIKWRGTLKGQLTRFMNDIKEFKKDSDIRNEKKKS